MHRDLKSPNVLLEGEGDGDGCVIRNVKLTDFGLAAQVHESSIGVSTGASTLDKSISIDPEASSRAERTHDSAHESNKNCSEVGTLRWMAPEVARREGFRRPADVYSFAMVLFELLTHELPFNDVPALHAIGIVAVLGARPPLPEGTPRALTDLIELCWAEQPSYRPTFDVVVTMLDEAARTLSEAERMWLDVPEGHPVYSLDSGTTRRLSSRASSKASGGTGSNEQSPAASRPRGDGRDGGEAEGGDGGDGGGNRGE